MLERALTQPLQCSVDPLKNAQTWNIPIWAPEKLQAWLDKNLTSYKDTHSQQKTQPAPSKNIKIKQLKDPYIKFESYYRTTRPVFLELQSWPVINFDGEQGSCPFAVKRRQKKEAASESKETKENWEAANVNKEKGKEMTRRPRASTRARRAEQLVSGYCEICRSEYRDLTKHLQTEQHLSFVQNDDNFLSLDTLISTGASVEAFLKLNSTNDVRKDCKIFPNGDPNLRSTVLSEKVDTTSKPNLDDFNVDEIKMVQCNGARRNIDLKISSPHNLRTRAKHESGHLLRSKGRSWIDDDKGNGEKVYDKFEGFTIKKRAKGTIWIEEDDPDDEKSENENLKDSECNEKLLMNHDTDFKSHRKSNGHSDSNNFVDKDMKVNNEISQNNRLLDLNNKRKKDSSPRINGHEPNENESQNTKKDTVTKSSLSKDSSVKNSPAKVSSVKNSPAKDSEMKDVNGEIEAYLEKDEKNEADVCCTEEEDCRGFKPQVSSEKDAKIEKARSIRFGRRGGRSYKGRQRLSVEERLIEDNRAYYKVEVLGSKLRSSVVIPPSSPPVVIEKEVVEEVKKDEVSTREKPVVVRFKRVRKSELSLLSDEAESFMFGETRRDDSSEASESEQTSVLPKDSESERDNVNDSSSIDSTSPIKQEMGDDSQDSGSLSGRGKKKRRTQAEALIKDNADYYKFETPGSRLRYQAPLLGIEVSKNEKYDEAHSKDHEQRTERLFPSKPSAEIERMQFSFEAIPRSEPWYQTYQRQDEGEEFWHYFSESNVPKPFLLPYEIENFHETLLKRIQRCEGRRRSRGRGSHVGRLPRKSPRCHASTLAIMSTIIRKREQQQQQPPPPLPVIDEVKQVKTEVKAKVEVKSKSEVDEDLKEIAKNIDEMLSANDLQDQSSSFEEDFLSSVEDTAVEETQLPKGAPVNLLELLENCHELMPCLENSSCASSDCGDGNGESPLKRRKRRKNRTGWPGNKLRRKIHSKLTIVDEVDKKPVLEPQAPLMKEDVCERLDEAQSGQSENNEVVNSENCISNSSESSSHENNERTKNTSEVSGNSKNSVFKNEYLSKDKEMSENEELSSNKELSENVYLPRKDCNNSADEEKKTSEIEQCLVKREESKNQKSSSIENEEILRKDSLRIKKDSSLDTVKMSSKRDSSSETGKSSSKRDSSSETGKMSSKRDSSQLSEVSSGNDENLKIGNRKRHHISGTSSDRESLTKRMMRNSVVTPRKRNINKSIIRNRNCRRTTSSSETRVNNYKTKYVSRRRQMQSSSQSGGIRSPSSSSILEDENCKQNSFVNISSRTRLRRVRGGLSSENGDVDCPLSERVNSPIATPTDLQNRRSSIEFQPVVRVMKIEDQVDRDHSILSVAVASNRRLRSSGSSKSNQPPKKRFKSGGRGHFNRWLKSS